LKIPDDVLDQFEEATEDVDFGAVALTVHFNLKSGKPRFTINREKSFFPEDGDGQAEVKTGRSHVDIESVEKAKAYMRRRHPEGVRIIEIAEAIGCSQSKALRILDYLSKGTDFLVSMDDEAKPTRYYLFRDKPGNMTSRRYSGALIR